MNLYLSSYMIGDHVERLLAIAGGTGARMAIITNALDAISVEDQLAFARNRFDVDQYFAGFGFDPSLIDLRRYAGRQEALRKLLLRFSVIWAIGGNTFLLRRAMRESGFDQIIRDLLRAGISYGGWSAGACVAGDSLRPVGIMDEPEAQAQGYLTDEVIWEGLGLVPFTIIPHFESSHSETMAAANAMKWAGEHHISTMALRDGDVLLVEQGGNPVLLGRVTHPSGYAMPD